MVRSSVEYNDFILTGSAKELFLRTFAYSLNKNFESLSNVLTITLC